MSTHRPEWFPAYGDPVRCPIRDVPCVRFACVNGDFPGHVTKAQRCEARKELALVPKSEEIAEGRE